MNTTILITILIVISIAAAVYFGFLHFGKIQDLDKDGIPDKVEDAAKEVKRRAKRVKEEASDVIDAIEEVGNQVADIADAAKGKTRTGRKKKK